MCGLDFSTVECGNLTHPVFVTNYTCPGINMNAFKGKNAHLSFVSGHASISCSSALFVILFVHSRMTNTLQRQLTGLLIPLMHIIVASLAIFTCLTRISDYWHFPTDVLGGSILGMIIQYLNCVYVMDLFGKGNQPIVYRGSVVSDARTESEPLSTNEVADPNQQKSD